MKVKYIPNALSILRMVLSLSLFLFLGSRAVFFIIFVLCGVSDLLDGIVARKTHSQSALGARLDSFGDMLFFLTVLICTVIWAGEEMLLLLPYIAAIVVIRFANLAIAAARFHRFAIIHTFANKATGLLVFVSFGVYILTGAIIAFIPVCAIAALSALEETLILLTSKELDLDRKSIFIKTQQ
jgi:CDP-diacylglycerol--glycerol-3-phosphate 3-phosphatidyltransferase